MRRRGLTGSLAASPTMVGALTVMVVILAVFLAYNANSGLPFVPSYRISVELPNADLLVPGNDVRVGGVRAGVVESIEPQQDEDGNVSARLDLKLNQDARPAAGRLDDRRPRPLRARAQVPGDQQGHRPPTASRRARSCRSRRRGRSRSRSTSS